MSYILRKNRMFGPLGDHGFEVSSKRSEGRMKRYGSCDDVRAWSLDCDERRRYLLELVSKPQPKQFLGKYVPFEVLIETLMSEKNSEIEILQQKLMEFEKGMEGFPGMTIAEVKDLLFSKESEIISLKSLLEVKSSELAERDDVLSEALDLLEKVNEVVNERNDLQEQLCKFKKDGFVLAEEKDSPGKEAKRKGRCRCVDLDAVTEERNDLLTKVSSLEKDLKAAECLKKKNDDLQKEVKGLKTTLCQRETESVEAMKELQKYKCQAENLEKIKKASQDEIEIHKTQSIQLDEERNWLRCRLSRYEDLEEEVNELKRKAALADDLEKELKNLQNCMAKDSKETVWNPYIDDAQAQLASENDKLRLRLEDLEAELDRARYRARESEILRIERDRLKEKLQDLSAIEIAYYELAQRTRNIEVIEAERELFKAKYEQLSDVEIELNTLDAELINVAQDREYLNQLKLGLECQVQQQEVEIKRLTAALDAHKKMFEDKEEFISTMKEQLAEVPLLEEELNSLKETLSVSMPVTSDLVISSNIEESSEAEPDKDEDRVVCDGGAKDKKGDDDTAPSKREELQVTYKDTCIPQTSKVETKDACTCTILLPTSGEICHLQKLLSEKEKVISYLKQEKCKLQEIIKEKELIVTRSQVCGSSKKKLEEKEAVCKNGKKDIEALEAKQMELQAKVTALEQENNNLVQELQKKVEEMKQSVTKLTPDVPKAPDTPTTVCKKRVLVEPKTCPGKKQQKQAKPLVPEMKHCEEIQSAFSVIEDLMKFCANEIKFQLNKLEALQKENTELKNQMSFENEKSEVIEKASVDLKVKLEEERRTRSLTEVELIQAADRMKSLKEERDETVRSLSEANSVCVNCVKCLECKYLEEKNTNDALEELLQLTRSELKEMKISHELADEALSLCQGNVKKLHEQLDEVHKDLISTEVGVPEIKKPDGEVGELRQKFTILQGALSTIDGQSFDGSSGEGYKKLEDIIKEQQKEIEILTNNLNAIAVNENVSQVQRIEELEIEVKILREQLDKALQGNDTAAVSEQQYQCLCIDLVQDYNEKLETMSNQNKNLQTEHENSIQKFEMQFQQIADDLCWLKDDIKKLKESYNKALETQKQQVKESSCDVENLVANLQQTTQIFESEIKSLKERIKNVDQIGMRVEDSKGLEKQLVQENVNKQTMECLFSNLEKEIKTLANKMETIHATQPKECPLKGEEIKEVDVKPVDVEPVDVKPVDVEPVDVKPVDVEPVDVKPADVEPVDVKPADVEPVDVKPIDVGPLDVELACMGTCSCEAQKLTENMELLTRVLSKFEKDIKLNIKKTGDPHEKCQKIIESLHMELKTLKETMENKCGSLNKDEMNKMKEAHEKEIDEIKRVSKENLSIVKAAFEREVNCIKTRHDESVARMQALHEDELGDRVAEYEAEFKNIRSQHEEVMKLSSESISELQKQLHVAKSKLETETKKAKADKDALVKKIESDHQNAIASMKNTLEKEKKSSFKTLLENHHQTLQEKEELTRKLQHELKEAKELTKRQVQELSAKLERSSEEIRSKLEKEIDKTEKGLCVIEHLEKQQCRCQEAQNTPLGRILHKVLEGGIEVLTFSELSFLHQQTCTATGNMMNAGGYAEDHPIATICTSLKDISDPGTMQQKITNLEIEFAEKERKNAIRVHELESAMLQERKRISEFRDALQFEQQQNIEAKACLKAEIDSLKDQIRRYIMLLDEERSKVQNLHYELRQEKQRVIYLQQMLDSVKIQGKDTKTLNAESLKCYKGMQGTEKFILHCSMRHNS